MSWCPSRDNKQYKPGDVYVDKTGISWIMNGDYEFDLLPSMGNPLNLVPPFMIGLPIYDDER